MKQEVEERLKEVAQNLGDIARADEERHAAQAKAAAEEAERLRAAAEKWPEIHHLLEEAVTEANPVIAGHGLALEAERQRDPITGNRQFIVPLKFSGDARSLQADFTFREEKGDIRIAFLTPQEVPVGDFSVDLFTEEFCEQMLAEFLAQVHAQIKKDRFLE